MRGWKSEGTKKLECLEIQLLLGKEQGIDPDNIKTGFWSRLSSNIQSFMKEEGVEIFTIHQQFIKDEDYNGVCRDFHLTRQ